MIKIYGMPSCPDCEYVHHQIENRSDEFESIDIGEHVRSLKEFIRLRDHHAAFADARRQGYLGIPCFVMDDGRICFTAEEAGLDVHPATPEACSLDGTGC